MSEFNSPPTPEQRIKELEKQLEDTKLRADFFEEVVKVMERDHGVRVVKKHRGASSKSKT
jgi:hypothetical protein